MKKVLAVATMFLVPVITLAQIRTENLNTTVRNLTGTVNLLIPFFLAIAVVVFIYGVIKYIIIADADGRASARQYIIYGVIGIAVILAIWGLARLLISTFGLDPRQLQGNEVPTVTTNPVQP